MMKITRTLLALVLVASPVAAAQAGSVNVGNMTTFSSGTPALASEVNGNFTEQSTQINDNDGRIITNAGDISNNASDISNNASDIATKQNAVVFGTNYAAPQAITSSSSVYVYGATTIAPANSGTCLVTGVGYLSFDSTDTGQVFFRLARQAGGTTNSYDSLILTSRLESNRTFSSSVTQSRSATFSVIAGETYKFGCYYSNVAGNYINNNLACSVSYSCF